MIFKEGNYVISNDNRPKLILKENATKFELKNIDGLCVIHYALDNGIIPKADNSVNKCDRIVECIKNDNDKIIYAVELKGKDVDHALEQLASTVRLLFDPRHREKCKTFCQACNINEIQSLKGNMIRLRAVSSNPGRNMINGKKRSATHNITFSKEAMLKQVCITYKIMFNISDIVVKTGHSECI